eukprot:15483631-Alexandrium_andersonii.AAC.1
MRASGSASFGRLLHGMLAPAGRSFALPVSAFRTSVRPPCLGCSQPSSAKTGARSGSACRASAF